MPIMFSVDDTPYTCSECQKRFRSDQNLREHLRTHTGERPYKCRICDKAFKTSGTRCRHERTHEGSLEFLRKPSKYIVCMKTYACTRCSEQFSSAAARSKHMKKSHKLASQYFCLQCDVELTSVEDLIRHHSNEHSSEKGETSSVQQADQKFSLTYEHQDHSYHRHPLYDMNAKNTDSSVLIDDSQGNMLKNSAELQKESLAKLGYAQLAGKQNSANPDTHFVCKYCGKGFFKLPLFLKHLLKHSNVKTECSKTNFKLEPSTIESEVFAEEPDITVENELADYGQTVMMSCRSSPVMVEVKNENEMDAMYLAEIEETNEVKRDLLHLFEEFEQHEIDSDLPDLKQKSLRQTVNISMGRTSRKRRQRGKRKKQSSRKSVQHVSYSDDSVCDESRVNELHGLEGLCADVKDSPKTVDAFVPDVCMKNSSEGNRISISDSSGCVLDLNKNQIFCEKCGGKLNSLDQPCDSSEETYACYACGLLFVCFQDVKDDRYNEALKNLCCDVQDNNISKRLKNKANLTGNSMKTSYGFTHSNMKFKTRKKNKDKKTRVASNSFTSPDKASPKLDLEHKPSTEKEPFNCTVCSRRFAVKYRLQRHMISHTGEKPFVCNDCGKAFTTNAYLRSHMARHTNELTYLCSTCGKRFADRIAWRYHKRVHDLARRTNNHTLKEHICWVCGYQFNRASNLARHLLKHQNSEDLLYKCSECGRKFRTKEGYRYHIGQHAPEKPYLCMDCPKSFADFFCLKTHLKSHAQQGCFECGVCGKKYRTMFILKMHAKHHTELRYSCDVCGEMFGFARQFRSHIIKHRPPFECEVCGVTTTRAADLRKHKRRFQH